MKEAMEVFSAWSNKMIDEKLNKSPLEERNVDLLDMMLESFEDTSLTRKELLNNIFLFFLAGHESQTGTLTATLYFLSRHQEVQDKVREELAHTLNGNAPTYDSVKSLQYLSQVINESSRLLGPVTAITRIAKSDCSIEGYHVPKNTFLILVLINMHKDKDIWGDDVLQFNPERWSPENSKKIPKHCFCPFGLGPRTCLASNYANLQLRITLVKLLQRFKFTVATPEYIVSRSITVRPQPNFMLGIHKL